MNSYQEFENFLKNLETKPKLLLHSCCGPCSTSVLELLNKYFQVDIYFYNPNIYPKEEYLKRKQEQEKVLIRTNNLNKFIEGNYEPLVYEEIIKGLETEPEGGSRCKKCISMRMEKACKYAKENGYDFYTTTLSVSPHKNSKMINEIGYLLEEKYNMSYLYSDFKKKEGYKRSILLSKEYKLYRQDYCGCKYSKQNIKKI